MEPSQVTMYGRDYSAREFLDEEFQRYMRENPSHPPVQFLGRYIGYPKNSKCISYYPGMYQHHLKAGRPSFLFHQIGYGDMSGGYDAGRAHAQIAKDDARSPRVGWLGESHIIACFDRFLVKHGERTLTVRDLREYMKGFRSVLGDRAGFYGFRDSMASAVSEGWAFFFVQCGSRSAHVNGIHAWQENNYQPKIFGTATDVLELYCDPAFAFGGDMALNAQTDWPAFSEMMERWWRFQSRTKGARPSWEDGPTAPEVLSNLMGRSVADIDEDALAAAFLKRGVDLGGASLTEIKAAFTEVLGSTKLTPSSE